MTRHDHRYWRASQGSEVGVATKRERGRSAQSQSRALCQAALAGCDCLQSDGKPPIQ